MPDNVLYYGNNLDILRRYVKDETVDLIYLDPPFNSNATYNVLFGEQDGSRAAAQIKAFDDTWTWDQSAAASYQEVVEAGGKVSQAMQAFRMFLGDSDMLAYLAMMAPRLMELRRVLKPTGSIYLHCDPTASHYLKMLMDAVFGAGNFRNEIVWHYISAPEAKGRFGRKHDTLLFYSKTDNCVFNLDTVRIPHSVNTQKVRIYKHAGKAYVCNTNPLGKACPDVWDIPIIAATAKERLGYPTQKPLTLLERIIKASSNEGNVVLDPFCGCGTAIAAAQNLNRRWIGIDVTHLAINLIKHRLHNTFGNQVVYRVIGEPTSIPDAEELAAEDPYQFQCWALGLVGARLAEQKKGADKGIDGKLYFHDEVEGGKTKQVVLSVKAGHTNVSHLRDLRGVLDREQANIGVLLTMQEPTQSMRTEAAGAGFYHSPGWNRNYPRMQILTVAEMLAGKVIDMPPLGQVNATFKKASRARGKGAEAVPMFSDHLN